MNISCTATRKNGIKNTIKRLEQYRDGLDKKCELFVKRLSDIGITSIKASLGSISPVYRGTTDVTSEGVKWDGNGYTATIHMGGDQALFIEFGSGVTFNAPKGGSLHPKGKELGMTIGSYNPESPNATNPGGWWYTDRWGVSQHTYGTPTFAPMYNSFLEMRTAVLSVAKEVFK